MQETPFVRRMLAAAACLAAVLAGVAAGRAAEGTADFVNNPDVQMQMEETTAPQDDFSDNTPVKPRNQERDDALYGQDGAGDGMAESQPPPTRNEVEEYRQKLEIRLLERYNNLPDHAGKVGRVTVVLSKPLEPSLDGSMIRAEFDQLVFDPWGKRIPALEEEYYVVTFGSGGARQVRSDPSIRVGLDLEKTYSERAPVSADPFRRAPESRAFRPEPMPASEAATVRMPEWWRPDFPELER